MTDERTDPKPEWRNGVPWCGGEVCIPAVRQLTRDRDNHKAEAERLASRLMTIDELVHHQEGNYLEGRVESLVRDHAAMRDGCLRVENERLHEQWRTKEKEQELENEELRTRVRRLIVIVESKEADLRAELATASEDRDAFDAARIELVEEVERLREAIAIVGHVKCDDLHHARADYHDAEPCPVVARYERLTKA